MAKRKKAAEIVHLVCKETGMQNYTLKKKRGETRLEVMKYCPKLQKHTLHVEKRK
ncbi:MAG: 50S ribosomal protein L33 [Planctomycetia bacterium]